MNILHITTHLNHGGIVRYLCSLAVALKEKGHTVSVASSGGDNEAFLRSRGIAHLSLPIRTKNQVDPRLIACNYIVQDYIRKNRIELMHAHTRVTQVLATYVSKRMHVPLVTTCHGFFRPRLHRRLFPCWGNRVIAISQAVKDHLKKDFKVSEDAICLIHSGVETSQLAPLSAEEKAALKEAVGLPKDCYVIGNTGRFSSVKGLEYLLRAIPQVLVRRRDVIFLLVGYGKEEVRLRGITEETGIKNKIVFHKPERTIGDYLDIMDIFVAPSIQEGLGLSILEAQTKHVPVIASNVGGIPDIIEHRTSGLLVAPKDPQALAEAIVRLLNEKALREYIVQNASRRVAEHFSFSRMVDETERLYKETIAGGCYSA